MISFRGVSCAKKYILNSGAQPQSIFQGLREPELLNWGRAK